jgi:methyl-accepting chemotaxis protein
MKLNQMRIGARLAMGFAALLLLNVVAVGVGVQRLSALDDELHYLQSLTHRSDLADRWRAMTELNAVRAMAILKSGRDLQVEAHFAPEVEATSKDITATQDELAKLIDSPRGKDLLADIATKRKTYVDIRKKLMTGIAPGSGEAASADIDTLMLPAMKAYTLAIQGMSDYQRQRVDARITETSAQVAFTKRVLLGVCLSVLLLGVLAAWLITRSVVGPLRKVVADTSAIAAGDLSQRIQVDGRDEVSELQQGLCHMQTSLRSLVAAIQQTSESISTASSEIAMGNADLSARTEQAASHLQQTASSTEQVSGTVAHTADAARTARDLATSASSEAQRSGDVVGKVVDTMHDISRSSEKIGDIISVIDGIAFQTNILALNAAVEAARAGEQGRGFAVVAGEVRSLAQRSAQAAKEIKVLIGSNVERVELGGTLVEEAGAAIQAVMQSTQRVSTFIADIAAATAEQQSGLSQINHSVGDLDRMTQQNAALVEQSAAAAESLRDQSSALVGMTRGFKVS